MVVNDTANADVVFIIEATAHISPYVESLKTNYIIPTLEYFNGSSTEERDSDTFNNLNCALYGIVTFMSMDCKPDSASACYAPTSNYTTFLQWLDKIQFIGGAGDSSSHIVEGLSTAINLIDAFQSLRDKSRSDLNGSISSKYCILICNSTPYMEPSNENPVYCGYSIEQLMKVMAEKNINFSVFSPRKMNFLYKLFESAGGNLSNALSKNYAKDRRHLVLLNGFHLQEKPVSPTSQPSSDQDKAGQQQGIKRSLSPSPNMSCQQQQQQMMNRNQQINQMMSSGGPASNGNAGNGGGDVSQFSQHSKLQSDNIVLQPRGGSPMNPWIGNGNAPSPSQSQRNPTSLPQVRARASTPQMNTAPNKQNMNPIPSPGQMAGNLGVQQNSPAPKPSPVNQANLRPANQIPRGQQPGGGMQAFNTPQVPSPQPSPRPRAVPSPISNSIASPISQPQQFIPQQHQINPMSQPNANMPPNTNAPPIPNMINSQRTRIWSGYIQYHDKTNPADTTPAKTLLLECQITYQPNSNEPEFTADNWPNKLLFYTMPKPMINRLSPIFKNSSYQVNFHFQNDSPALQKLTKTMTGNSVGCIQLTNPANIRIIIIFYMPEKKVFVGFIPHNQDEFMFSMREVINLHKKEHQVKQKMINMRNNIYQQQEEQQRQQIQQKNQQQIQQTNSPLTANQVVNPNPNTMSGPISIQIMHGQMGQATHPNSSQMMPTSNPNAIFQLQQIPTNANNANLTSTQPGTSSMVNTNTMANMMANKAKPGFIGNNNSMVSTSNAGINIVNPSTATGINQLQQQQQQQQPTQQTNMNAQMIQQQQHQQNMPQQGPGPQQQQFNMIPNSAQINIVNNANANNGNNSGGQQFHTNDREQNLMAIKQLEQTLYEAQRKEMEYQQQVVGNADQQQGQQQPQQQQPQQMMSSNTPQMQNSAVIRQQLQQQLFQKQHMSQMQQHQVNSSSSTNNNSNSTTTVSTASTPAATPNNNNPQLRHLLQNQHLRINRMQSQAGAAQQQQHPQQQQQILLQANQIGQQQRQFRFQSPMQGQQQAGGGGGGGGGVGQSVAPSAAPQQHRANFFEENPY